MAELNGRICNVPYDPIKPCHVVFDLGWADSTAYWIVQFIAQEVRLIRYHEDNQQTIAHYLALIFQILTASRCQHFLPKDKLLATQSLEQIT